MTDQPGVPQPYAGAWPPPPAAPPTPPPGTPPPLHDQAPTAPPSSAPYAPYASYGTGPSTPGTPSSPNAPSAPQSQQRQRPRRVWPAVLVTGLVSACVAALIAGGLVFVLRDSAEPRGLGSANRASNAPILQPGDIQAILAKQQPAVVSIWTGAAASSGTIRGGGSAGTGFVISPDGYIVTNYHVIEGADGEIAAVFNDGAVRQATIVGTDPGTDLAVIKVDAQNLPSSSLGSSSDLKVGDDVVAIGNALALDGGLSVTRGIVSAKGRSITVEDGMTLNDLIQTDAAINQGNSGGPLVNSDGDVIGINVAGVDPSIAQNIGFAIAIDSAKPIIEELKAGKDRRPGYLGVRTRTLSPSIAAQIGATVEEGAVIVNTTVDSPAEKAGLQRYDVITAINGTNITTAEEATEVVSKLRPGDKVTVEYERDGQMESVEVTLTARPS